MCHVRVRNAEKSLSFCHLTKQRLINELGDGVHERHGWHDDSLPDYRPKFRVFTEKAGRAHGAMSPVGFAVTVWYTCHRIYLSSKGWMPEAGEHFFQEDSPAFFLPHIIYKSR